MTTPKNPGPPPRAAQYRSGSESALRDPLTRNSERAAEMRAATPRSLRVVELDVKSERSVVTAVDAIVARSGKIDVVVHNAARQFSGVAEAFTPDQLLSAFDTNVIGPHRVNRAVLPHMRRQRSGLLLWIGSGTSHVVPPFLAPYTASKAGMDSLAESVAAEVVRYGIETTVLMPGPFTVGTEHFAASVLPDDADRSAAYGLIAEDVERNRAATEALFGPNVVQDVSQVAMAAVRIVGLPSGSRPYRVLVDQSDFGDAPVVAVASAQRQRLLGRLGLDDIAAAIR